ncbi:MAG: M23 family metallopeptidase [Firmicutes bacterium]|nr:M23 family metallopeptidase [Bacillota bacterium]
MKLLRHILINCWRRPMEKKSIALGVFILVSTILLALMLPLALQAEVIETEKQYWVVYVDGEEAGLAEEKETIENVLASIKEEAARSYGREVVMMEEVTFAQEAREEVEEDLYLLEHALRRLLSFKVRAYMLTVNGKDIAPLESKEAVEKVTELVQGAYLTQREDARLVDVAVAETIDSRQTLVFPEEIKKAEDVASILLRGTDRREVYLVSRGDSLWSIANKHDLSLEEIKEANPQLEGDLLQIGDELNLIVPEPIVNVTTLEEITEEENIPFSTEYVDDSSMWTSQSKVITQGQLGRKKVTYLVTKENGAEIAREKVGEEVIKEPVTQVIARGTAKIPSQGTGSFSWPVRGGGRITSTYGWRSGSFHAGVDIGAPAGTAILAADSGVVVFSGRESGYGNSIVIYHGHYYTRYAHNSSNLVQQGQTVAKGQKIATMGSTGRTTGTHLHFEVRTGGKYGPSINPLNFFNP